jgi:hypothetical protein
MGKRERQMCCQWEEGSWWYGGFKEGHDMNPCILNYEMTKMYNTEVDCMGESLRFDVWKLPDSTCKIQSVSQLSIIL